MKSLIALLLSLVLLFPAASLGAGEDHLVEFDDFTLIVGSDDLLLMDEETRDTKLFELFPNANKEVTTHSNIIASWIDLDMSQFSDEQVAELCNNVLQSGVQSLTAEQIVVTNEQQLIAERDEETGTITMLFSLNVDTSAWGMDMKLSIYMGERYIPLGEKGTYRFTVSGATLEEMEMMFAYLDKNLMIKE